MPDASSLAGRVLAQLWGLFVLAPRGRIAHVSHQNGLDVDVYYPRRDRRECAPIRSEQVDPRLSQSLVDLFVAAGAARVFVGRHAGVTGPAGVVQHWPRHEDHLHARFPAR